MAGREEAKPRYRRLPEVPALHAGTIEALDTLRPSAFACGLRRDSLRCFA
jgi:hypothetical protein